MELKKYLKKKKMNLNKSKKQYNIYKKYIFKATNFIEPIIEKGKGSYVWDIDGNKYLDINSGQFCAIFGHSYKPLIKKINEQLNTICHTNTMTLTNEVLKAAKKLGDINDGDLKKTIFLSTGAEANECAIRYAKFITGKNKIISFNKGYHGLTLATQSITMEGLWARPKITGSIAIETPDLLYPPKNKNSKEFLDICLEDLYKKIKNNKNKIAAIILEPILGTGGIIIPPKEYFKKIREICNKNKILLIFDECQTGFGRTGKWFCYQHFNIIPDILVTAKGIGMGLPVSAVTFRKKILKNFEGNISHFSSHQNDPLAACVVNFVIQHIKDDNILDIINNKGDYLIKKLKEIANKNSLIKNPRGLGLMIGFDLPEKLVGADRKITNDLINMMEKKGVLIQAVRQGITFRILPNYMISYKEIDSFIKKLNECLKNLSKIYCKK